jgi:hypothetical protein
VCSFGPARSELQAGFARGLGQRLDAAVVGEARAVEGHRSMPAALAFSAMRLPTRTPRRRCRPCRLPPSCSRTSFSAVEALASTWLPSPEMTLA